MCGPQVRFCERGPRATGAPYSTVHSGAVANAGRQRLHMVYHLRDDILDWELGGGFVLALTAG